MDQQELKVVITGDASGGEQTVNEFSGSLEGLTPVGVAAGEMLADLAEKVIDLGKEFMDAGFEAASSIEHIDINLKNLIGNQATDKLLSSLQELSTQTPFTAEQFDKLGLKFAAAHIPAKQIQGDLMDIADIASGTGSNLQDMGGIMDTVSQQLAIAFERGSISSIQLRGIAAQNIPIYDALAEVINKNAAATGHWADVTGDAGKKHKMTADQVQLLQDKISVEADTLKKESDGHKTNADVIKMHNDALDQNEKKLTNATATTKVWVQGQKVTAQELTKNVKGVTITAQELQQALQLLSETKFANAAVNQSKTLDGELKNLKQTVTETFRDILTGSSEGIVQKGSIFDTLETAAAGFFTFLQTHGKDIQIFVDTLSKMLKPSLDLITETIQQFLLPALKDLGNLIGQHQAAFKILAEIVIGVVTVAIVGLIGIVSALIELLKVFVESILFVVDTWRTQFVPMVQLAGVLWDKTMSDMGKAIKGFGDLVSEIVQTVISDIKGMLNGAIDAINGLIKGVNSISSKVKVPAIPQIPHFASGVSNFSGGLAIVGEQGAELVNLPSGSSVSPAGQTKQMLSNQPVVNINYPTVRSDQDIRDIVSQVVRVLGRQSELARLGAI